MYHVIPAPEPESNNSVIAKSRSACGNLSLNFAISSQFAISGALADNRVEIIINVKGLGFD